MIDIVVLTLKSTPQRAEAFRKRNSGSIKFTFHYGLDASQIPAADYWRLMAPGRKEAKIIGYQLAPGELACAMGHHAILDNFVKSRRPADFLVVLEDDVVVPKGTPLLLQEISKTVQDSIVILGTLYIFDGRTRNNSRILGRTIGKFADRKSLILINPLLSHVFGTFSYMVSCSVAKRLLLSHEDYILMADDWKMRMRLSGISRVYCIDWTLSLEGQLQGQLHSTLRQERVDKRVSADFQ